MVDFMYNSTGEEVEEDKKSQYLSDFTKENSDPLGLVSSVPDFDEFSLSFADSFLDFDDLRDLISDSPMADSKQEPIIELGSVEVERVSEKCEGQAEGSLNGVDENSLKDELLPVGELGFKVEEEMGRVSISEKENERQADVGNVAAAAVISENEESGVAMSSKAEERIVHGDKLKGDKDVSNPDTEEESESESESQSSSSASSSDSDDKEEEDEDESSSSEEDMEEGEIVASDPDEMVNWDDDEETGVKGGPIRSKNEVQVLPPVPEVTATLQPHHQMQPVGVVSSIIGAQVVVEGVEKHSPLNDGSILWITESRSPLGIVDEIFGPVKNPYYIVRYNSDHEVPSGIHPGTLISFVPEFSNHILNANSLYKKGYDASGENDEETSDDEFSDDEKEAEYKRMLKMKKRGMVMNDQKPGNRKKDKRNLKNRSQNWKHDQGAATDVQRENGEPSVDQGKHVIPTATAPLNQDIHQSASRQGHGQSIRSPSVPPLFPHMQNSPGLAGPSTGVWNNGIPFQQPQNMGIPNTLPNIGMPWHPQQIFQMPSSNAFPFQQQINPTLPSSFMFPGGLPNFGAGPSFGPWPPFGQNVFSQSPMAMGLPGQFTPSPMNLGGEVSANGPQSGQNNISQPNVVVPGYINGSPNFNQGQSPLPMNLPGQFTPTPMNLGGQVPENGPQSGQNNNSQPRAMVPDFNNGSPNFNQGQSPLPMNLPCQFTPTPMNLGGQVPENGPKSEQNNNSQPRAMVPGFNNGSPNFNRGAHSGGGRRGNHRGGGRFNGRRGRSQRN